jgi:Rrf2 family protein
MRLDLTKRADYAIRAVLALERSSGEGPLSVRRIAAEQRIPLPFLPQVMRDLVRAGLVEGTTGRTGGYRLARPASDVSLLHIVEAVEGDRRRRTCIMRGGPCGTPVTCDVHAVFVTAEEELLQRLDDVTVADLTRRGVA